MKAAAVLVGCLVALASTEPSTEPPQRMEVFRWILNVIKFDTDTDLPPTTSKPRQQKCPTCECGRARTRFRIVGGSETKILEFPWMALVTLMDGRFCGGSVINDLYVLTAAHCTIGLTNDDLSVRLLEHDRSDASETKPVDRKVAAIIRHSRYDPKSDDNDIALLKLNEKVELGQAVKQSNNSHKADDLPGVRSVCLPPDGRTFANEKAMVIGWGHTTEEGFPSDKLMQVTVPILSNEDCRKTANGNLITDNMMCAGVSEGGYDSCQGDSGGPLQVLNSKTGGHMQVGVVSWGLGCAQPNNPGVYTRVNRYLDWIKTNTRGACYCSEHN